MKVNIKTGTRSDATFLCRNCQWASVIRGAADSQEFMRCSYHEKVISFPVVECTDFADTNQSKLRDMEKIAWVIEPSKRRAGFRGGPGILDPKKWREENPDSDPLDDCPVN